MKTTENIVSKLTILQTFPLLIASASLVLIPSPLFLPFFAMAVYGRKFEKDIQTEV